jgi:hypothetical protein
MIPQELKGTGAVPFLEWFNDITDRHLLQYCNMPTLIKIAYFYSLPFDVSMLVNPIPYPNLTTINFDSEGKCTNPEYINWQQAEDKVIFEGWEKYPNGDMILKADNKIALSYDGHNKHLTNYYNEFGESQSWEVKSLNDFITLCNLSEINLTFKK